MATIGASQAVADLGWTRFNGRLAWLAWLFIHLIFLVEFENRLLVLVQWAWNYFTRDRSARLITGRPRPGRAGSVKVVSNQPRAQRAVREAPLALAAGLETRERALRRRGRPWYTPPPRRRPRRGGNGGRRCARGGWEAWSCWGCSPPAAASRSRRWPRCAATSTSAANPSTAAPSCSRPTPNAAAAVPWPAPASARTAATSWPPARLRRRARLAPRHLQGPSAPRRRPFPDNRLPARYSDPETSGQAGEVKAGLANVIDFHLE